MKIPKIKATIAPHSLFLLPPNFPTKYLFVNKSAINKKAVNTTIDNQNIIDSEPLSIVNSYKTKPAQIARTEGINGMKRPTKLSENRTIIKDHNKTDVMLNPSFFNPLLYDRVKRALLLHFS